jgi:hypothetical protein
MVKIAPLMATGQLALAKVIEVCKRHGIDNLAQAVMVPNLVPAIEADLMAAVAA